MSKDKVQDYDATAANNSDVAGIDIAENCAAANINDAIRAIMSHIATALIGSDDGILTGTQGTDTYVPKWNADGDLVDGYEFLDEDDMASDSATAVASQQSIKAFLATASPPGMITPYAGSTAPTGWLLCDGSSVAVATYGDLHTAIGYTYGGSGANFNLPDLRGRVPVGKDNMGGSAAGRMSSEISGTTLGATGGSEQVTLTTDQMPQHSHEYTYPSEFSTLQNGTGSNFENVWRGSTTQSTSNAGGNAAHSNTQPGIIANYIIKT